MADFEVIIEETNTSVHITQTPPGLIPTNSTIQVVTKGVQGPQGPPGPTGGGGNSTFTETAGATVSAFKAVVIIGGQAFLADPMDITHVNKYVGVSLNSVGIGGTVTIQSTGKIESGVFASNSRLYIGAGGSLSTSPTFLGSLWQQQVGVSSSTTDLVLTPFPAIIL